MDKFTLSPYKILLFLFIIQNCQKSFSSVDCQENLVDQQCESNFIRAKRQIIMTDFPCNPVLTFQKMSRVIQGLEEAELMDPLQYHVMSHFTFHEAMSVLKLIDKKFYKLVTGFDVDCSNLSIRQATCVLKKHETLIKCHLIKEKNKQRLKRILVKPYQSRAIPNWIWPLIEEIKNPHFTWIPFINTTCATTFVLDKMPIVEGYFKDCGPKNDQEELGKWTKILQASSDVPMFQEAFQERNLKENWFHSLCELNPERAGEISNYIPDCELLALAQSLKNSFVKNLRIIGHPIKDKTLKNFVAQISNSKIVKISFGFYPIVKEETKFHLKQQYPHIEWHFNDCTVGSCMWVWQNEKSNI